MDTLNLWNDDPEAILLDLGFGSDEPDLSGRIPTRFINYQSQARGINLQVFLEAQKNRLDLESPDVSNRFRQLEVFQQVTTAFSSLVGSSSSPLVTPQRKDLPPERQERRRHIGMLFRRASKKAVSQIQNNKPKEIIKPAATSPLCAARELPQPLPSLGDKKVPLKRAKPGLKEMIHLSPLAEEQVNQEEAIRPWSSSEGDPVTATSFYQKKKIPGIITESFEVDEIQSLDESSVTGTYMEEAGNLVQGVIRTNSCQPDSSGFLEELSIPSLSQQETEGSEFIKAKMGQTEGNNETQSSTRLGYPFSHSSPSLLLSSSFGADKFLLSSPCSSPGHLSTYGPSSSVSLCLPKAQLPISEREKPPDHNLSLSHSALLPTMEYEYLPHGSSSLELQNITHFQSQTHPSPDTLTSLSLTTFPMQLASLIRGSKNIKTNDKDTPSPHHSTLSIDCEGIAWSTFFTASASASSPTSSPTLDYPIFASIAVSSKLSYSSSLIIQNIHSEGTDGTLHENSLSQIESHSLSPENEERDFIYQGFGGCPSDPPTKPQKKDKKTPWSVSFQLSNDKLLAQFPSHALDLFKCKNDYATPPSLSPYPSSLVSPSSFSSKISDMIEQSISLQDRSYCHDDNTDSEDNLHVNGKGAVTEKYSDAVQTREGVVYIADRESSASLSQVSTLVSNVSKDVCNQTEKETQMLSCSLHEHPTKNNPKESQKIFHMEANVSQSESPRSSLLLHDGVPEAQSNTKVKTKDLIENDSLDLAFQTSVDGSECENGDVDAFFQQVDTEGLVYWAEPIQVYNANPLLEESESSEALEESSGNYLFPRGPTDLHSFPSTERPMPSLSTSSTIINIDQSASTASSNTSTLSPSPSRLADPDFKSSSKSVSVQMSSSLSSHIVCRKDIPYMINSKCTHLPSVLPLDTSTPFRAVQSWTDLHIYRNTLTNKLSHGAIHTVPNKVSAYTSASEMTLRPKLSQDCFPGISRNDNTASVSVDKGLWPNEVARNGNEDEDKFWEGNQTATMAHYCTCDHQCTCHTQKDYSKQHTLGNFYYSQDELKEMMLCLQQFCSVFSNVEEQLSEDQAAVYSLLSDQDRKKVWDIEELRRAVKQEAGKLEVQLNELFQHFDDDSLKTKMHRLLDEQSLLCSQLRVFLPGTTPTSLSPISNRTVATQCCLLLPPTDVQSGHVSSWSNWNVDSRLSPPGSEMV